MTLEKVVRDRSRARGGLDSRERRVGGVTPPKRSHYVTTGNARAQKPDRLFDTQEARDLVASADLEAWWATASRNGKGWG